MLTLFLDSSVLNTDFLILKKKLIPMDTEAIFFKNS